MHDSLSTLVSFGITGVSGLALIPLATAVRWVDQPRAHKTHEDATPLVGGLAIYLGVVIAATFLPEPFEQALPFLVGGTFLLIVGAIDDRVGLAPSTRFAAQIGAALIMTLWGGVVLRDLGPLLGGTGVELGIFAVPFTLFAAVGVINAVNMIDGLDGLAGGLVLIALLVLSHAVFASGAEGEGYLLLTAAAAVLAFLLFNFRLPGRRCAAMFMGDGGSLFLGYALAWALISLSQAPHRAIAPVTALWIVAIPLCDAVGAMLRRMLRGQSPFQADRQHFHHVLLAAGFSVPTAVSILLMLAAGLVGIGYGAQIAGIPNWVMLGLFMGLFWAYFWALRRAGLAVDAVPPPHPRRAGCLLPSQAATASNQTGFQSFGRI
jgi:UDP-GlcNAc:undecaprenyl-phosphate/decaprenyl-phosphate GlcNAc-1-phosphate transferase